MKASIGALWLVTVAIGLMLLAVWDPTHELLRWQRLALTAGILGFIAFVLMLIHTEENE